MTARRILGPQDRFEGRGSRTLRDIRPGSVRLATALRGPAGGLVMLLAAAVSVIEPASLHLLLPAALLFATSVLMAPARLPLRLPRSALCRDPGSPLPGSRRPRMADGTILLGWSTEGDELWITAEDARQHIAIPGTTGAGKTTAILGLLSNALAQGSGFVLVDGKADRELFGKVLALARRFGREDDVRVLNFMVASGSRDSHTFNPFATGNADSIRELLASQLADQGPSDANGVFRERAVALLGTITPVLVWLRDHRGVPLNIDVIRFSIELRWIWKVAKLRRAVLRDAATGAEREIELSDIPVDLVWPLEAYLGELPGYDPDVPLDKQKSDEPGKQHGYAQFYFTATFAQLAVSLGHIFRVEHGDVDMRDIVLNRRILVVNLPALENSDATLAALGKLVVASLRGMMAQLLGGSLEGDYSQRDKPGMGPSPFFVVFDELAYYATSGLDRMLAMGRGLNIAFILGFQEVAGMYARIGERTASLLGNTNLILAMRQQDAGRTREWLEKTAGQTDVAEATSWERNDDGAYREGEHANLRTVARVDWNDLTSLLEGEAIVLAGGRRIYGRVFHADIDDAGPKRLGRGLGLAAPDSAALLEHQNRLQAIADAIEDGIAEAAWSAPDSPAMERLLGALRGTPDREGAVEAALAAMEQVPASELPAPPPPPDGRPLTVVSPMLDAAALGGLRGAPGRASPPPASLDSAQLARLEALGRLGGEDAATARANALQILAEQDRLFREEAAIEPPAVSQSELASVLDQVLNELRALLRHGPSGRHREQR